MTKEKREGKVIVFYSIKILYILDCCSFYHIIFVSYCVYIIYWYVYDVWYICVWCMIYMCICVYIQCYMYNVFDSLMRNLPILWWSFYNFSYRLWWFDFFFVGKKQAKWPKPRPISIKFWCIRRHLIIMSNREKTL